MHLARFLAILVALLLAAGLSAQTIFPVSPDNGFSSNYIQDIAQDSEGIMWIGTSYGLSSFDGRRVLNHFPSLHSSGEIDNDVSSVAVGEGGDIYFGTRSGFGIYNKYTDKYTFPDLGDMRTPVSCILITSQGTVLLAAENGIRKFDPATGKIAHLDPENRSKYPPGAVKALTEDDMGQIWIGTWNEGIYRYSPFKHEIVRYPKMNPSNSAHSIVQDCNGNIWVGVWNGGVQKLVDPYNLSTVHAIGYYATGQPQSLPDNSIYALMTDNVNRRLWVGARGELSYMDLDNEGVFHNVLPIILGADAFCFDSRGNMWIGSYGESVYVVNNINPLFKPGIIYGQTDPLLGVTSFEQDSNGDILIGKSSSGAVAINETDFTSYSLNPYLGYVNRDIIGTIYGLLRRRNGELWVGIYGSYLRIVYPDGRLDKVVDDTSLLHDVYIMHLMEDRAGNVWIGTKASLSVRLNNGEDLQFPEINGEVVGLGCCSDDVWVAVADNAVYRLRLSSGKWNVKRYSLLTAHDVMPRLSSMLASDEGNDGHIYVGTEEYGLFAYNRTADRFEEFKPLSIWQQIRVMSILDDDSGNLWLASNRGLFRMPKNQHNGHLDNFTTAQGLPSEHFTGAALKADNGKLYFGTSKGFISFLPEEINSRLADKPQIPFGLSGLVADGIPYHQMTQAERVKIVGKSQLYNAHNLTISPDKHTITLEFTNHSLYLAGSVQYAYRLDDYDNSWHYIHSPDNSISYSRLIHGSYTLHVMAADENGIWGQEHTIVLKILPNWWATWWAWIIYAMLAITTIYLIWQQIRRRENYRLQMHRLELEKSLSDENNQMKLTFFTNITHELLTPLTVISAGLAELRRQVHGNDALFASTDVNTKRLMRLLQQILEFRKAESKNLKLRVSYGNLCRFVQSEVTGMMPLFYRKGLDIELSIPPEAINGYFDSDKVDKILYNLLSNAAKYCPADGHIWIKLSRRIDDKNYIELCVSDNGKGIAPEKQLTLFRRFYEGEYRESKTIGTGIGLSLTKDLVDLHHGHIAVESEVGKGTSFIVTLPLNEQAYAPSEISQTPNMQIPDKKPAPIDGYNLKEEEADESAESSTTLLIVEDESSLLEMMQRILSHYYNIVTAKNGVEALEQLHHYDIDLIVTDLMMPDMDGLELTRKVKSDVDTNHIPILVLTAKHTAEDRAEVYEAGADAFLSKPFDIRVLLSRIDNLLRTLRSRAQNFRNQLVIDIEGLNLPSTDIQFLEKAVGCVKANIDKPDFDVATFASEMGLSKNTLYHKLRTIADMSPNFFIRNIRLKIACAIMEEHHDMRISEIAYAVGFNDPKYFSVMFRKEFGLTPKEYMAKGLAE